MKSLKNAGHAGHRIFWPDTQSKSLTMTSYMQYALEYGIMMPKTLKVTLH